ncbi:MAG TPA: hypothetical protein VMO47_00505 [Rhodothermales bacterium]|nr:hypothetical protein [Rhodothermales bacterium]
MSDEEDWRELLRGLSDAVSKIEDAAAQMDEAIQACDRFLSRAQRGGVSSDILEGLSLGLAFSTGIDWARAAPAKIADLHDRLVAHDAMVSDGELPASAHTWRYQLLERLSALDTRTEALARAFAERRVALETLHANS